MEIQIWSSFLTCYRTPKAKATFSSTCILKEMRYESRITKSPELNFSALVGDGTQNVRFERMLYT